MKGISLYKLNAILLLLILSTVIMWFGRDFLIPLLFSILFAMLLLPLSRALEFRGVGRIASTFISTFIIILFVLGILGIIIAQAANLLEDLPALQLKAQQLILSLQQWIETRLGIAPQEQISYLESVVGEFSEWVKSALTSILSGTMSVITDFVLTLLYFFFIMWKREKYKEFFLKLVDDNHRAEVRRELSQITHVSSQYLIARLISMLFLGVIYSIGFSIAGLENGVLVALVTVLPTIVPYIGPFVGGFFPLALVLLEGSMDIFLPVASMLIVAQIIDNNFIEPMVEGESLNISPIFTIIAIVLGGLIWGVAGMILFMPMFAIIKIVCDHIPALHPFSFLLTNETQGSGWVGTIKRWFKKDKRKA